MMLRDSYSIFRKLTTTLLQLVDKFARCLLQLHLVYINYIKKLYIVIFMYYI